jgi:hypothetical protein
MRIVFYSLVAAALFAAETFNFDTVTSGSMPSGWSTAMTSRGGPPKWEVLRDDTAPSKPNVLAQTSNDPTSGRFPLAIYDKGTLKDGDIEVRFKPISGRVDQAAGIVWRYRDPNNYYIVRANARENNVVLYKVENGRRTSLAPKGTPPNTYGVDHPVPAGRWSTLGVRVQGNLFTVLFDGKQIFQVEDNTFRDAGRTGLWTKADSVTYFDDFRVDAR